MRKTYLFAIVALLLIGSSVSAQSVIIRPKKVVYERTAKGLSDWKRTFEVTYPIFSGKISPAALRRLKLGTDYWRVFDMKLADNLRDDQWLSSCDYVVNYNKHNILDILLVIEGDAAYPDSAIRHLVFDIRSGRKLGFPDIFYASRMPDLLGKIRTVMKLNEEEAVKESDEVRETLEQYREGEPDLYPTPDRIQFKDLDGFRISDTGVTFIYDYGYAHVVEALEPPNEFFLSYSELKPFIRTDGLLARFVR
jgi:hypothetical protein